jgi:hypothetical protein
VNEESELRFVASRLVLLLCFVFVAGLIWVVDGRSGHIFAVLTGVVAVVLLVLPPFRINGRYIHPLLIAPAVWILSMVAAEVLLPPRCSPATAMRGAIPVILKLNEYRSVHGRYPRSVAEAGVKMPRFRCGTYQYTLTADGNCKLKIGDYGKDSFTAWWQSDTQAWYVDT